MIRVGWSLLLFLSICLFTMSTSGQTSTVGVAPVSSPTNQAAAAQSFDVKAAVDAYLAKMPAAERAWSDAYFEGGYWLLLWDFLVTVIVMWVLLRFRWSGECAIWLVVVLRASFPPPYPLAARVQVLDNLLLRA